MALPATTEALAFAARPTRSWATPALIFSVVAAALVSRGDRLLADPDTHWHLKVGADIWANKAVPWIDSYSHTFNGAPWIAKEWLSQVLMHLVQAVGGMPGLVLATAFTVAALIAMTFLWLAARLRVAVALMAALLALVLIMPHILARPHIFALIQLLFWTRGLVDAVEDDRTPSPWLLAWLILWANLHNSFTIAYPIAGLLALEAILKAPAERRIGVFLRWSAFGVAALAAGCVTPYGARPLLVAFTLFGSSEQLPFIHEWDPIGWTLMGALATSSAVIAMAALAAGGWRNGMRIALIAALTVMFIRHVRFLDVYAVALPFLLVGPLVRRFPGLRPDSDGAGLIGERPAMLGALAAAGVGLTLLATLSFQQDPLVTPRAALSAARAAGVADGPVYNSHDFGGFLISQGVPTFIDGRSDQIYLGGFFGTLLKTITEQDRPAFIDLIGRYGVNWALVQTQGGEAPLFEATPGWTRLYRDEIASVYAKS